MLGTQGNQISKIFMYINPAETSMWKESFAVEHCIINVTGTAVCERQFQNLFRNRQRMLSLDFIVLVCQNDSDTIGV